MGGTFSQNVVKEVRSGLFAPAWVHGCWNSVGSGAPESTAMPRPATTMMLVSDDRALIESCQGVTNSIPDLRLILIDRIGEADSYLAREQITLILIHLVHEEDA